MYWFHWKRLYLQYQRTSAMHGVVILSGGFAVLVESMLTLTFGERMRIGWSLYPLAACTLIGLWLLIVAICPNLRNSLKKKFFV